jgi:uncharacterized protein YbaA (DUF1428 family)
MERYIDAYMVPVPKKNLKAYKKVAHKAGKIWIDNGALQYIEAVGEDMQKHPYCVSFKEVMKPKRNETIIVAYVIYRSRAHRDRVNKKVMEDPRMTEKPEDMPFDCERIVFNGFETIVNLP